MGGPDVQPLSPAEQAKAEQAKSALAAQLAHLADPNQVSVQSLVEAAAQLAQAVQQQWVKPAQQASTGWRWHRWRQRAAAPTCAAPMCSSRAGRLPARARAARSAGGRPLRGLTSAQHDLPNHCLKACLHAQLAASGSNLTQPPPAFSRTACAVRCGTAAPHAHTPTGGRAGTAACAGRWGRCGGRPGSAGRQRRLSSSSMQRESQRRRRRSSSDRRCLRHLLELNPREQQHQHFHLLPLLSLTPTEDT